MAPRRPVLQTAALTLLTLAVLVAGGAVTVNGYRGLGIILGSVAAIAAIALATSLGPSRQ